MKYIIITLIFAFSFGCSTAGNPVAQETNAAPASNEKPQTAISHSSEDKTSKPVPPAGGQKSKWTQSGEAFDTTKLDTEVTSAEKALSSKPTDAKAKKALAEAYLKRAVALTEKSQYASALGDYRRTLKNDPENAEAKEWIERIIQIYASINREYPQDGEEPPPLPFTKAQ